MQCDERLRTLCQNFSRVACDEKKKAVEDLWDEYEVACRLSRGKDPNRSAHWEFKARTAENKLWLIVKRRAW